MDKKIMAILATNGPLTRYQIGGLTRYQIGGLTQDQIGGLTRYQIGGLTRYQIGGLTRYQIGWLTQDQIGGLTQDQIGGLTQDQIGGLTRYQIGWLTQDQIGWLTRYQIGGLTRYQIGGLTRYQIGWLTQDQIGWLTPVCRNFVLASLGKLDVPVIEKPYSKMLADIKAGQRCHQQSTFGPDDANPDMNVCGTPMCTAGHLVNMGGAKGYALKKLLGYELAATLIHRASRPDVDPQNFAGIPQEWAMAYIEARAEEEEDL